MKKILFSLLTLGMSVSMFGRTIYLNTTTIDYGADNALLAIWTWGGTSSDAWSVFAPVSGEEKLFSAEIADDRTGGKIVRFGNSVTTPDWSATQWNATGDLTISVDENMITLSQWDGETPGTWSTYTPAGSTEPAVALTVTGDQTLGSTVTLSATASNIEGTITYKYAVKIGEGDYIDLTENTYELTTFGTYTFKVDAIVGDAVKATNTKTITIKADWYVKGSFNGWNAAPEYGMKKTGDNEYSISFTLDAGTYEFKLNGTDWIGADAMNSSCSDNGWEGTDNIKFTLPAEATVTIIYNGSKICLTSTLGQFGTVVITTYTIVGEAAIVGAEWAEDNSDADMINNGDGTWTWTISNCALEAKTYEYKVIGNHKYAIYEYPSSGNMSIEITEAGTYDIVYTFVPATPELSAVATKKAVTPTALQESIASVIYAEQGRICGADNMRIYTVSGMDVTELNGQLNNGIYIVKANGTIHKIAVK